MLRSILGHPLVLLAVGAVVSGILVPLFTRQWQSHAQELEVKTDLVHQVNASVLPVFRAFREIEVTDAEPSTVQAADRAYVAWFDDKDAVGDNIAAYFPDANDLNAAWETFNSRLQAAGVLMTMNGNDFRAEWIRRRFPGRPELRPLARCSMRCRNDPGWFTAFVQLENLLHARKQELVHELLDANSIL
jgi:hypothetical protein